MTVMDDTSQDARSALEQQLARFAIAGRALWLLWHQQPEHAVLYDLKPLLQQWPHENVSALKGLNFIDSGLIQESNELKADYAALFIGPGSLKAAPWASVYLTEEQTTFGEPTVAVRNVYRQHGMAIETGENEPDDHIGLMFAFIAWLCEQGLEMDEDQPLQPVFCTLRSFVSEHLLTWAYRLCELVCEQATTDFYRGLGWLTLGTLQDIAEVLDAQVEPVKLYR